MNAAATILAIMLSNQGYWFGGQPGDIEVRWAMKGALPDAVLSWELQFAATRVAGARVALRTNNEPTRIVLTPPEVRVRTDMEWTYQLHRQADGQLLAEGAERLSVFPPQLLAGVGARLAGKTVLVCDVADGLPKLLSRAGVRHRQLEGGGRAVSELQVASADIILIGADQLADTPFNQMAIVSHAQAGASVVIFAQTRVTQLVGYPLLRRPAPQELEWRMDHTLLVGLTATDLRRWPRAHADEVRALQLPVNEPALEIAYWPRETPGPEPVPIDALLVVKQVGAGRIVLCQLPLDPRGGDPRSFIFVRNVLNYAITRPEPTPPPSARTPPPKPAGPPERAINISPGDQP